MLISNKWTRLHSRLALKPGYWIFQQLLTRQQLTNTKLANTILEFTAATIDKCVCQDEMCLSWLASVKTVTLIQVISITVMKNLLL
jgi:hypothetical protein